MLQVFNTDFLNSHTAGGGGIPEQIGEFKGLIEFILPDLVHTPWRLRRPLRSLHFQDGGVLVPVYEITLRSFRVGCTLKGAAASRFIKGADLVLPLPGRRFCPGKVILFRLNKTLRDTLTGLIPDFARRLIDHTDLKRAGDRDVHAHVRAERERLPDQRGAGSGGAEVYGLDGVCGHHARALHRNPVG